MTPILFALGIAGCVFFVFVALCLAILAGINAVQSAARPRPYDDEEAV